MTNETDAGQKLDELLTALDSITKRMDAMEGREVAAAKQRRADSRKRRADATEINEKSGEPMRPETPQPVAADSKDESMDDLPSKIREAKALRDQLNAMERDISRDMREQSPLIEAESSAMADAQARADEVYAGLGKRAPAPLPGERMRQYRARLLKPLQQFSETWKHVALAEQPDKNLLVIEKQIFADAVAYADSGSHLPADETHAITKRDESGRQITTFKGANFVRGFKQPARLARLVDPREIRLREMMIREGL